jgi:hypothetical protein
MAHAAYHHRRFEDYAYRQAEVNEANTHLPEKAL